MTVRSPPRGRADLDDPFDLWLRRSLRQEWGGVLDERVPEDLLRLCSDDRLEWETMKIRWLRNAPQPGGQDREPQ